MKTCSGKLIILDSVDSTNNYAMGMVHEGVAAHGDSWLAREQTAGKGRRGKVWRGNAGESILMSIALKPQLRPDQQFQLSAMIAGSIHKVLNNQIEGFKIKWPNDIYWGDRKAGGILIENVVQANNWLWAICGIGINVNQASFEDSIPNAVSLKQISGTDSEISDLANHLMQQILLDHDKLGSTGFHELSNYYNQNLYKRGELVSLKKENARFQSTVRYVTNDGRLVVEDTLERSFAVDEIEWII